MWRGQVVTVPMRRLRRDLGSGEWGARKAIEDKARKRRQQNIEDLSAGVHNPKQRVTGGPLVGGDIMPDAVTSTWKWLQSFLFVRLTSDFMKRNVHMAVQKVLRGQGQTRLGSCQTSCPR